MSGAQVLTLGCRLNHAESETIARLFADASASPVVVNGCAVTEAAVRDTERAVRRAGRDAPGAPIIVTGCAATVDPARFATLPGVTGIVPNDRKLDPVAYGLPRALDLATVARDAPQLAVAFDRRTRGFVGVQTGCDHACTFCTIPAGRGVSRSVPVATVVEGVARLVDQGAREIVLTGVDVTSYGHDLPDTPRLGALVAAILRDVPDLPRLRLSSLDGVEIDPQLFDLLTGEARVMPHVHLSFQAGSDLILKRMRRRHLRADAIDLVARLRARRPEIAIGADLIAGFPTEDAAMFADTLALIGEATIVHAHIFPYSPRPGTPAARMPQVDPAIVRERAARLRDAAAATSEAWHARQVGRTLAVLVEAAGTGGHAPDFCRVRLDRPAAAGTIVAARVTRAEGALLHAEGA